MKIKNTYQQGEPKQLEQLRRHIQYRQIKLVHDLQEGITELLPYIDDVEALQTIYAHTLAAFYDEGKPADDYLQELKGNRLQICR